jgi:two-component system sensor histidine kinase YesM
MLSHSFSLRVQLVAVLVLVMTIILSISFAIYYSTSLRLYEDQRARDTISAFQQTEININSLLDKIDRVSISLMVEPSVLDFIKVDTSDRIAVIEAQRGLYLRIDSLLTTYGELKAVLFFLDDGRIGGSSIPNTYFKYSDSVFEHPFYATEIYKHAKENKTNIFWVGGYTLGLFSQPSPSDQKRLDESGPLPRDMLVMGIRAIQLPQAKGRFVLVTAFQETTLRRLYEKLSSTPDNLVAIIDDTGKLISGIDGRQYGQQVDYFDQIDMSKSHGSLTYRKDGVSFQLVYYRLAKPGWTLVSEVPTNTYEESLNQMRSVMIFTFLGAMSLIALLYALWTRRKVRPLEILTDSMKLIGEGDLALRVSPSASSREIHQLNLQFNQMLDEINGLMIRISSIEQDKRLLEIEALQAQINPHFIYNTIATLRWMATLAKANTVANALVAFSNVLRPVFSNIGVSWSMEKEIEFTRNYISIMNYRFGGSIEFTFDIQMETAGFETPRFILQPLVENAITHGLTENKAGRISIKVAEEDQDICLTVEDNGVGVDPESLALIRESIAKDETDLHHSSQNIGLRNVSRRILLHFGKESRMEIESETGRGTSITIHIPKIAMPHEDGKSS